MEKHLQDQVLSLLRGALTGKKVSLSAPVDIPSICDVAWEHGVVGPVFYGMTAAGYTVTQLDSLYRMFVKNLWIEENQTEALRRLYAAFEENGIDYMPLKGAVLRELYPHPNMRAMGDADILIRIEQYPQIQKVLTAQGFSSLKESDHELIWANSALNLELHKRLIPSYHPGFFAYFGDGWQRAVPDPEKPNSFTLSDADQFLYLFAHFTKHYCDGGVGIRQATDLWVYLQAKPHLDTAYIEQELEKIHLLQFYQNIRAMLRVWFEEDAPTEMTDFLTDALFESGLFGKHDKRVVAQGNLFAGGVSAKYAAFLNGLGSFFPNFAVMQRRYAILQKLPVLLPFFWVVRWFEVALRHPKRITQKQQNLALLTTEAVQTYRDQLRYVGLDENNT